MYDKVSNEIINMQKERAECELIMGGNKPASAQDLVEFVQPCTKDNVAIVWKDLLD